LFGVPADCFSDTIDARRRPVTISGLNILGTTEKPKRVDARADQIRTFTASAHGQEKGAVSQSSTGLPIDYERRHHDLIRSG
jgi:hypothetical protein